MAKVQTRRSISINGGLYDLHLKAALKEGIPLAKYTERALDEWRAKVEIATRSERASEQRERRRAEAVDGDHLVDPCIEYDR